MHAEAPAAPAACENCQAMLQGAHCHVCGQRAANPLRHFGHALEEVFEAVWHLDGRVFRTLRDLLVPGRVACNYVAGQRVRYIAPLRLFVVLSLLTFFVGRVAMGTLDTQDGARAGAGDAGIAAARTPAEVDRRLEAALAEVRVGREQAGSVPLVDAALREAEAGLRTQADGRKAALAREAPAAAEAGQPAAPAPASAAPASASPASATPASAAPASAAPASAAPASAAPASAAPAAAADDESGPPDVAELRREFGRTLQENQGDRLRDPARPWDAHDNPIDVAWVPAFLDPWLNQRIANSIENIARFERDQAYFLRAMLGAVPPALFVLVPVFALLLRLFYIGSRRGYLEHMVVALYSHAFLLLALLALFVLGLAGAPFDEDSWPDVVSTTLQVLVWFAIPVYLLVMQKRVYAQGWLPTLAKYLVIGALYLVLLVGVALYAMLATLTGA